MIGSVKDIGSSVLECYSSILDHLKLFPLLLLLLATAAPSAACGASI